MLPYEALVGVIESARTQLEIRESGVQAEGSFSSLDEDQRSQIGSMLWDLIVRLVDADDETVWPTVRMVAAAIQPSELPVILESLHVRGLDTCLQAALQIVTHRTRKPLPPEVVDRLKEFLPSILEAVYARPISTTRDVLCLCALDVIVRLGLPYHEWSDRLKEGRSKNFGWSLDHHIQDALKN